MGKIWEFSHGEWGTLKLPEFEQFSGKFEAVAEAEGYVFTQRWGGQLHSIATFYRAAAKLPERNSIRKPAAALYPWMVELCQDGYQLVFSADMPSHLQLRSLLAGPAIVDLWQSLEHRLLVDKVIPKLRPPR